MAHASGEMLLARCRLVPFLAGMCVCLLGSGASAARNLAGSSQEFFIFGYGSLLNKESRQNTDCSIVGLREATSYALQKVLQKDPYLLLNDPACDVKGLRPVRVVGYQRGWYAPGGIAAQFNNPSWAQSAFGSNLAPTYLGAVAEAKAVVTGVVYQVTAEQLALEKTREQRAGYDVVQLPLNTVTFLDNGTTPSNAQIYFFASPANSVKLPTKRFPIVQSYVDVWLTGAYEVQTQFGLAGPEYLKKSKGKYYSFVNETISETKGWSKHWLNDRVTAYRPFVTVPFEGAIDAAVASIVDEAVLKAIRLA